MDAWNANTVRVTPPRRRPDPDFPGAALFAALRWFQGPALSLLDADQWRVGLVLCLASMDGTPVPGDWNALTRFLGLKSQAGVVKTLRALHQVRAIGVDLLHECGEILAGNPPDVCPRCGKVTTLGTALLMWPGDAVMGAEDLPPTPKAEPAKAASKKDGLEKAPSAPRTFTDRVQMLAEKAGIPKAVQNNDFWRRWQQNGWRGMWKRLSGTPWEDEREAAILRALDAFYAAYYNFDAPQSFATNIVYALQGTLKTWKPDARPALVQTAPPRADVPERSTPGNTSAEDVIKEVRSHASPTAKRWI